MNFFGVVRCEDLNFQFNFGSLIIIILIQLSINFTKWLFINRFMFKAIEEQLLKDNFLLIFMIMILLTSIRDVFCFCNIM